MLDELAAIRRESDAFYATAETADATRAVPSCPDWNVGDLVWHLGEVHWFWATIAERRLDNPDDAEKAKPARPDDYAGLVAFGRAQADRITDVLSATPADTAVWTWGLDGGGHTLALLPPPP